jgi:hypothetical protein
MPRRWHITGAKLWSKFAPMTITHPIDNPVKFSKIARYDKYHVREPLPFVSGARVP